MDMAFSALVAQAAAAPEFAFTFLVTSALIVFVPWKATHKPIYALLNSEESKKDLLTETWRGQKIRELTFVGVSVRSATLAPHCSRFQLLTSTSVRHPRQHRHRCHCLAIRRSCTGSSLEHQGFVVFELDFGTHRHQQRDAAECGTVPPGLLRRRFVPAACHTRTREPQSRWQDIMDRTVESNGRLADAGDATQLCHFIIHQWCNWDVEGQGNQGHRGWRLVRK